MSIDFSIQQQGVNTTQHAGFSSPSAAVGSLFGNTAAVVESPMSLLADAAEELTFAADTTDDFELEERKERDEIDEAMEERVRKYQELMREKGEAEQIDQLKDAIRAREGREHALRQARQRFPDPSDAWAALKEIRDELAGDAAVSSETLRGVDEALAELETSEGPAIRSGICGALNAKGFGSLGSPSELGALYRGAVCDFADVNELYAHIQEAYGNDFDAALDFLYKTLASDMAADMPSMEKPHLEHQNPFNCCSQWAVWGEEGSSIELRQLPDEVLPQLRFGHPKSKEKPLKFAANGSVLSSSLTATRRMSEETFAVFEQLFQ